MSPWNIHLFERCSPTACGCKTEKDCPNRPPEFTLEQCRETIKRWRQESYRSVAARVAYSLLEHIDNTQLSVQYYDRDQARIKELEQANAELKEENERLKLRRADWPKNPSADKS